MANRRRRRRAPRTGAGRWIAAVCGILAAIAAAFSFVIEEFGGRAGLPTWDELYRQFGVSGSAPDPGMVAAGDTTVTFLDVGQGDAVLICQDGAFCLIDAGTSEAADGLVRDLRAAGVDKLDYLVMTHPHADHIGGMPDVLEAIPTELLILPDLAAYGDESAGLERTLDTAAENGVPLYTALDGDAFALGGGTLTVLQAGEIPEEEGDEIDANNLSLCLRYTAGDFAFVDTGDAEEAVEEQLVARYGSALRADLLKAGHHGSDTSNTAEFLAAVSPQAVVASCGLDNDYGHPHAEVVDRVAGIGADLYRTDLDGAVTVVYDTAGLQIYCTADGAQELAPAA